MRKKTFKRKSLTKANSFIQSKLKFPDEAVIGLKRCLDCYMTYSSNSNEDILKHKKHHDVHLNGKKWQSRWGSIVMKFDTNEKVVPPFRPGSFSRASNSVKCDDSEYVVAINHEKQGEIKKMLEIMETVNNELCAPCDDDIWLETGSSCGGCAFLYIKQGRAVGAITIEYMNDKNARGCWMQVSNRSIVPNVVLKLKLGISRIWVCKSQRRNGLATRLLECARKHAILGNEVRKWEMGWSQPTESGGLLARRYNSVKHSSGELLIPCYI